MDCGYVAVVQLLSMDASLSKKALECWMKLRSFMWESFECHALIGDRFMPERSHGTSTALMYVLNTLKDMLSKLLVNEKPRRLESAAGSQAWNHVKTKGICLIHHTPCLMAEKRSCSMLNVEVRETERGQFFWIYKFYEVSWHDITCSKPNAVNQIVRRFLSPYKRNYYIRIDCVWHGILKLLVKSGSGKETAGLLGATTTLFSLLAIAFSFCRLSLI